MTIITLIILLVIVGVGLWLINTYIPMDAGIKKLLNIVVIIFMVIVCLYFLLGIAGIGGVPNLRVR